MKVSIIGAMEQEVTILRNKINNLQTMKRSGYEISTGSLYGASIALLKSGIGKVSAAIGASTLFEHYRPDVVLNIGSAGSLIRKLNIGDIIVASKAGYQDVDITAFGYKLGQIAHCPTTFAADNALIALAKCCASDLGLHSVTGMIGSGDTFINTVNQLTYIKLNFPKVIAVDMEAAAIAHACYIFDIPFVAIRAISDIAGQQSPVNFNNFLNLAAKRSTQIAEAMIKKLALLG